MFIKKNFFQEKEKNNFRWNADNWWGLGNKSRMLHKMNPLRFDYILKKISNYYNENEIKNLNILDVGCGGGILTESLASICNNVVGVDINSECIDVARGHAAQKGIDVDYLVADPADLVEQERSFDVLITMETVEHVDNYHLFLNNCSTLLKKGGLMFISTINRNIKSFIYSIVVAEYLLGIVPRNTHNFRMFRKPHEVYNILLENKIEVFDSIGLRLSPINMEWSKTKRLDVNYIIFAKKI